MAVATARLWFPVTVGNWSARAWSCSSYFLSGARTSADRTEFGWAGQSAHRLFEHGRGVVFKRLGEDFPDYLGEA